MSSPTLNNQTASGQPSTGLDKDALYGDFRAAAKARSRLAMKAAHKALDLAEDDMQITANKTTSGVGAKGLIGVALAAGIPTAVIAALLLWQRAPAPTTPTQPLTAVKPAETKPDPASPTKYNTIREEYDPATGKTIKVLETRPATPEEIAAYLKSLKP